MSLLFKRCLTMMCFSRKGIAEMAAQPVEWHVLLLSLFFGALFTQRIVAPHEGGYFFALTLGLVGGAGFVYSSSHFLSWLLQLSGKKVAVYPIRMVLGYALTPAILGLLLIGLADLHLLPKMATLTFILIVMTWVLNIYGLQGVTGIPWIQALFVTVIPMLALMLVIALLFKIAWMIYG